MSSTGSAGRAAGLFLVILCLWPGPADAQFRYLLSADVREVYNSNVFSGVTIAPPTPGPTPRAQPWDLITEVEPGFRAYYNQPTSLLLINYEFTFQLFAFTNDPETQSNMLGYANHLHLDFSKLFSADTGIRFLNRFQQGTENTQVQAGISGSGQVEAGFLTTAAKYISEAARLEVQHLWTSRWSSRAQLDLGVYRGFDRVVVPGLSGVPNSVNFSPSHRLDFLLTNDVLFQETAITALLEMPSDDQPNHSTIFLDVSAGWRHHFNTFWDATISGGIDFRAREIVGGGQSYFDKTVGPLGSATVRFRYGTTLLAVLEYIHRYQLTREFEHATTADTDQVGLYAEWTIGDWLLEGGGSFRYLRAGYQGRTEQANTKVATARGSLAYLIRAGLTVEAGYDLELVRDRPMLTEGGVPLLNIPTDYTRHVALVGFSFLWPPPPPQDTRLTRRASSGEPLFVSGRDGAIPSHMARDDDSVMQMRTLRESRSREERLRKERERLEPPEPVEEVFDTEPDETPIP